jgi:hypothetical protein
MHGVAEGEGPEITLIVLGPAKSGVNHHSSSRAHGGLDAVFGNSVVMVATNAAMLDPLTLTEKLGAEFFAGVDPVIGAVVAHTDANGCGFLLKGELGLNRLTSSETDLVNHGDFPAGGVAEKSATTELL